MIAPNTTAGAESGTDLPAVPKRAVLAWAMWDWGSAAFNAVVTTFVFTVYLTSSAFGTEAHTTSMMSWTLTIAGIVVALVAPVLGQSADRGGRRKRSLAINTAIVVACTALLVFVAPAPQFFVLGLGLLAIGTICFEFGSVNYYAMLHQVSTKANVGRVSGFGWGMGYIGGIVLLGILLAGFIFPDPAIFGIPHADGWNIRIAMLVAAAWFALSAIPVFFAVPEASASYDGPKLGIAGSYRALGRSVARLWRESPNTLRFLIASAVFRDGLTGVFTFGGIIAARAFGFSSTEVILFAIAANVVAGIATIALGAVDDRVGPKPLMLVSLVSMVAFGLLVWVLAPLGAWVFWVFGLLLCIFVGPVQSASRSYLSRVIPAGQEGEIFGLYATTGRAVSFLAPAAFGIAVTIGGQTIVGILGLVVVLLLGLLLLVPVKAR